MSLAHPSWSPVESTDRPITFTFRSSNSGLIFAIYPSSVVQTGVKSLGCENSTAQESPIQSWKLIVPSVVSAVKSGAVSPILSVTAASLRGNCVGQILHEASHAICHSQTPQPRKHSAGGGLGSTELRIGTPL